MRVLRQLSGVVILAGLFGAVTGQTQQGGTSGAVVYDGARLIIGDASTPIETGTIVVQGGRISAVGAKGSVTPPAGATRVDLTGKTVMPALVNTHTHVGWERFTMASTPANGEHRLPNYANQYTHGNIVDHLQRYAYYGVGTIHNSGNDIPWMALQLQAAQAAGKLSPTARFLFAGGIGPKEGGIDQFFIRGTLPRRALYEVTRSPEARASVQDIASRGIKSIKIWLGERGGEYPAMPWQVFEAVIDEAHKHNIRVQAHALTLRDQKDAVRAGADFLSHALSGEVVDAEMEALVREKKPYWNAFGMAGRSAMCDKDPFVAQVHTAKLVEEVATTCAPGVNEKAEALRASNFQKMVKAGARPVLGTDSGVFPNSAFGWPDHHQLASLVTWGMTPAEAIQAVTLKSAEALQVADVAGSLAIGKSADFIVLNANPLEDIRNSRQIADVYLRGVVIDRKALSAKWQRGDPVTELQLSGTN